MNNQTIEEITFKCIAKETKKAIKPTNQGYKTLVKQKNTQYDRINRDFEFMVLCYKDLYISYSNYANR